MNTLHILFFIISTIFILALNDAAPIPKDELKLIIRGRVTFPGGPKNPIDSGAILTVKLQDTSLADAPAKIIAKGTGKAVRFPIAFAIKYSPSQVTKGLTYSLSVTITNKKNELLYINNVNTKVTPLGASRTKFIDVPVINVKQTSAVSNKGRWPELVGLKGQEAVKIIKQETGFTNVVTVKEGSPVTLDYRTDRVRIFVDDKGFVKSVPTVERDPGAYPSLPRFADDELKHLLELGPYQPRLSAYPKLSKAKKDKNDEISVESHSRKTTSFQAKYYEDFPLIEYSILKDRIYCFVCRLFGHGPGALCADSAWTNKGLQQWTKMTGKDGKLIKHFQSTAHISANERLQMFKKEDSHVDIQLDKNRIYVNHHRQELFKLNHYIIMSLLDAKKFLARQSLSFRAEIESEGNFNQIVSLLRRHNNTINKWYNDTSTRSYQVTYLSNDAQNEFISILGKAVHDSIISRLNKSLFWSVMVDSTPDVAHKDMMSISGVAKNF